MKYWVYLNGEVPGSYSPEELAAMQGFGDVSMVCPAEGGIAERNWQRAGEFPEIVEALSRASHAPQAPPYTQAQAAAAAAQAAPQSPEDILTNSSARIFAHVTELMKEMENRREERALVQSLQRQLTAIKNELMAARERIKHLEGQSSMVQGFEDRERKLQEFLTAARAEVKERNREIAELNRQLTSVRQDLERSQRSERSLSEDLKHQSLVMEDISRQLAQKELTLAKSFGVIRKLEEMLGGILPGSVVAPNPMPAPAPQAPEQPHEGGFRNGAASAPAEEMPVIDAAPAADAGAPPPIVSSPASEGPSASFTTDSGEPESPQTPPEGQVRPVQAPWQMALKKISSVLRKPLPMEEEGPDEPKPPESGS